MAATEVPPNDELHDGPPPPPEDIAPPGDDDPTVEQDEDDGRPAPTPPVVDVEEEIEPKAAPVMRHLTAPNGTQGDYEQKSLTYFGKIQLYGLLARAVKVLMEGEDGLGFDDVMDLADPRNLFDKVMSSLPGADTSPDANVDKPAEMGDVAKMMGAFAKVVSVAPDMLVEFYCIVLTPLKGHWRWLTDWGLPSMDDEMGVDILHVFIDQNWGAMEDFFARELPKLFKRAARARQLHRSAGDQPRP